MTRQPRRRDGNISKANGENGARARIIEAAMCELIAGDGDFEIADVARRADVSVGLAYHYFGSKAGLIAVLITDFHDRHEAVVDHCVDKSLPWSIREKIRLKASIDFLYADPATHLMVGKLKSSAEAVAIDTGRRARSIELAARNVAEGQRRGYISKKIDPTVAGAAIIGGINQAVAQALSSRKRPNADQLTERLWTFITGGLLLTPQAAPRARPSPPEVGQRFHVELARQSSRPKRSIQSREDR
jgi:AcrR family transcriptional regulator